MRPVPLDRLDDLVDALLAGGDGLEHRRLPRTVGPRREREHVRQLAGGLRGALAVRLVDHVDVADLEDPGLRGLDAVTHARRHQHERAVRLPGDLDLGLPDADGLQQDHLAPRRRQHAQRLRRGPRQTAEMAARRHRADVDPLVLGVGTHADAVAQERPTGVRRRRIDREHADAHAAGAVGTDERRRGRRLPDARRTGQPDDVGVPDPDERRHHVPQQGRRVLDETDEPGDRAAVPVAGPRDEIGDVGHGRKPTDVAELRCLTERQPTLMMRASPCPPPPQSAAAP